MRKPDDYCFLPVVDCDVQKWSYNDHRPSLVLLLRLSDTKKTRAWPFREEAKPKYEEEVVFICSPSAGLNSKSIASSDPSSLLSLMLSTSHQKSSMEVLSMEACELERLNAGGADSLESILLTLRQWEKDFLKRESNTKKISFPSC